MALKWVAPVNTNMIATAIRPASLQEESRLTPSDPIPRKRMNETTRMNKGAMSVSSLPRRLRLHVRLFLTQQLQHNPLWGWVTHSNELFIENSFGELRHNGVLKSSAVEGSSRLTPTSQGFQDVLGTAVLAFG